VYRQWIELRRREPSEVDELNIDFAGFGEGYTLRASHLGGPTT